MTRLIQTELLKLSTVRTFKGIVAGALAFTLIRFGMVVASAGKIEAPPLGTAASTRDLLLAAASGSILFLVFGVLSVVTETRHGTIGWTFLATPRRGRVVAAKVAAVSAIALAYLVATSLLLLILIAVLFAREGIPFRVVNGELMAAMAGAMLVMPAYAVLGVGLGALIRHQVPALMIPLAWLLILENMLPSFGLIRVMAWLPGGATAALARADIPGLLPMWAGALLLIGYAVAAVVLGGLVLARRDVT